MIENPVGVKHNRLTCISRLHNYSKSRTHLLCICDCGNLTIVELSRFKNGHTKSCGCSRKGINATHGGRYTRLYEIWCGMKKRCYNKRCKAYSRYGKRGISICDDWLDSFSNFELWSKDNGYDENLTLDRIDNDGDYEPNNCRWVNRYIQANNRSTNKIVYYNGSSDTLANWCRKLGLNYSRTSYRLNHGFTVVDAFNPVRIK